uniref:Transglutaminase-like domain-containing protein n=1 Tax=Pyramimonas orientalis virus TaxID=455367 RepID=A0A7M3UP56_POV01|nr:hypothetical protein HWQ62_00386 [Pyramimonas orientalis virus]
MDIPYLYSNVSIEQYKKFPLVLNPSINLFLDKLAKKGCTQMTFTRFPYYNTRLSCKSLALKKNEGNCVAFAFYMKELLKQYRINGYIVGAKSPEQFSRPGYREINHAAVIVPHTTGYLLFDTAFYFHKAILLSETNSFRKSHMFKNVYSKHEDKWSFALSNNNIVVSINDEPTMAYYQLKEILNPQKSITLHTNSADRTIFRCEINSDFTSKLYYKLNLDNSQISVASNDQPYLQNNFKNFYHNGVFNKFKLKTWIYNLNLLNFQKQKIYKDVKTFFLNNEPI